MKLLASIAFLLLANSFAWGVVGDGSLFSLALGAFLAALGLAMFAGYWADRRTRLEAEGDARFEELWQRIRGGDL